MLSIGASRPIVALANSSLGERFGLRVCFRFWPEFLAEVSGRGPCPHSRASDPPRSGFPKMDASSSSPVRVLVFIATAHFFLYFGLFSGGFR